MLFNVFVNIISVILWLSVHLSMFSWRCFHQYSAKIPCRNHWLLFHITVIETLDTGERGMNPVALAIFGIGKAIEPVTSGSQVQYAKDSFEGSAQFCRQHESRDTTYQITNRIIGTLVV